MLSRIASLALVPVFVLAVACGSQPDDPGTAGSGSAISANGGDSAPAGSGSALATEAPPTTSTPSKPLAEGADCGGSGDDDDDDDVPTCAHGYVCKPNPGQENSELPHGTCQKAPPGSAGADCTDASQCMAGLVCLQDKIANDGSKFCTLPDDGTENGRCEGRTDTKCQDGLTCVRADPSDLEGICKK